MLGDSIEILTDKQYDDKISSDLVKKISKNILEGLDFLHSNNLVHNDLKLDNILVTVPNKKILEYIEKIKDLDILSFYNNQIEELTPEQISLSDKKKKKIKKKNKEKST